MNTKDKVTEESCLETAIENHLKKPCQDSLEQIMEAGRGLVLHFARLYAGGCAKEDIIQAGYEGLIKAAGRFDPGRGVLFATYASHYIMGEMRHQLRREAAFDHPGWLSDMQSEVYQAMEEHLKNTGRPPRVEDIAREVNVKEDGVLQIMRAGRVSLDQLDLSRITHHRPQSFQLVIEDRIALQQALARLSLLQCQVIYNIFYRDLTQTQAAWEMGIGQRRVSRLLKRSLTLLSQELA